MSEVKHSPLPWITDPSNENLICVDSRPYEYICRVSPSEFSNSSHSREHEIANASFVIRAVNNHDALVAALEGMIRRFEQRDGERPHGNCGCTYCEARLALAAAKEEA